jgi:HEAT repeat protein
MPDLQPLLADLTSDDDQRAETAVHALAELGETALSGLLELLENPEPDVRWWAIRALAGLPHPQAASRIQANLHDPDPAVRQCAALGLSHQPNPAALPELIDLLAAADRLLARLAADALIALGSPAVPALLEKLANTSPAARVEAARALALIADPAAIPGLFAAWEQGSALLQYWAEAGLERMGVGMQFFTPE